MKKRKILAAVMFLVMFSSAFAVASTFRQTSGNSTTISDTELINPDAVTPWGSKGIWMYDNSTYGPGITVDANLDDWVNNPHYDFNGVDTYLCYTSTHVYVAVQWADSTIDNTVSLWNKTGSTEDNTTHAIWDQFDGSDDMLTVGFSKGKASDYWVWANSFRGDANYAYEMTKAGKADAGDTSFTRNIDTVTEAKGWLQPKTDNFSVAIANQDAVANLTVYKGWFEKTPPTLSQTDVAISHTFNVSGNDMHIIEFARLLNTGQTDDIVFDFSTLSDYSFCVGAADGDDAEDMIIDVECYVLSGDNDNAATFTWNAITDTVNESLLVTGTAYDDYRASEILVNLELEGSWRLAEINYITGDWSVLYQFNKYQMPLGFQQLNVTFAPKYETPFVKYQNVTISDDLAPEIIGIVDLNERYPTGLDNDTDYVTVTVGVKDDYTYVDELSVLLYYYKDDDIAKQIQMIQFSSGGSTYDANISLTDAYNASAMNNYTYFVQVFDSANNKITSDYYWFILGEYTPATAGFGIILGIFGLAGASFIIYKKFKK